MTDQFITLTDQISKQVEDEKLETLGARNKLKSMTENRKQQQQQLTALFVEKKMEFERLRVHYESLLKDHEDQREFIEQFMLQKQIFNQKYIFSKIEKKIMLYVHTVPAPIKGAPTIQKLFLGLEIIT